MKKLLIISFILICSSSVIFSKDLPEKESRVYSILSIPFSEEAKSADAHITWQLTGVDWDKFDYSFTQGDFDSDNKLLTLSAKTYNDYLEVEGQKGLAIKLQGKKGLKEGEYHLIMKIYEISEILQLDGYSPELFNINMGISYIQEPIWKKMIIPGVILLSIILILILILHLTAKFPSGLLQLNREEIILNGKKVVSIREELNRVSVELEEGTDVVLVKKRFGSYNGPCIKEIKNCLLERDGELLSKGSIILSGEEIHGLRDVNGDEIVIMYT